MIGRDIIDHIRRPAAGLRRVDWIRVLFDDDGPRAEVVGLGHRLPVSRPIPLAEAVRLVARGTRLVVRHGRTEV